MKKQFSIAIAFIAISLASKAQTVTTTTITGNLKVNDSLHVVNNISTAGDVKATGEVISKDTMRAQKDILIDGNAVVGGDMKVAGTTSVSDLNSSGVSNLKTVSISDKLVFSGGMALKSIINTTTGTTDFNLGGGSSITGPSTYLDNSPCYDMPNISSLNYQDGKMTFWGVRTAGTKALTIGYDAYGFIESSGGNTPNANKLFINYRCGQDINMCTGTGVGAGVTTAGIAGGVVATGQNVEIGLPTRNMQASLNMLVKSTMQDALVIKSKSNLFTNDVDLFSIGAKGGVKITATSNSINDAGFTPYALSVYNKVRGREVLNVTNGGALKLTTDNTPVNSSGTFIINNATLNKNVFIIKPDGTTGIGTPLTNNPNNYKLAVNGMIGAKEIKVEIVSTTWADFVFEKNYNLMSLANVEAYILKHKHLPNVPTVADVEANNGIEIGKTQTLLLQKIEELTLYLINESKRIEKLEQENALLKQQLKK